MSLAAASLLTVTRTASLPARARAATCFMVPGMSAVSVLVMDCTITGALLPTRTPPMAAVKVFLRWIWAMFRLYFKPGGEKARGMVVLAVNQKARYASPDGRVAGPQYPVCDRSAANRASGDTPDGRSISPPSVMITISFG